MTGRIVSGVWQDDENPYQSPTEPGQTPRSYFAQWKYDCPVCGRHCLTYRELFLWKVTLPRFTCRHCHARLRLSRDKSRQMSLRAAVFAMYVGVVIILVLIGVKFESGIAIVVVEATAFPLMFLLWLHLLYTKVYFVEPVDRDGANPPSDDAAPP